MIYAILGATPLPSSSAIRLAIGLGACLVLGTPSWSHQPPPKDVAFEVASIRPSQPGHVGSYTQTLKNRFQMTNMPVREWLKIAFGVDDYAINGPAWLNDKRFDLIAKFPEGTSYKAIPDMLKALLVERFELKVRWETKPVKGLALMRGKKDPKLSPTAFSGQGGTTKGRGLVRFKDGTVRDFATLLSAELQRPVVDKTGVQGSFDIALRWNPGEGLGAGETSDGALVEAAALSDAVREQLGLELKADTVMVPLLVVEHIAVSPSEN